MLSYCSTYELSNHITYKHNDKVWMCNICSNKPQHGMDYHKKNAQSENTKPTNVVHVEKSFQTKIIMWATLIHIYFTNQMNAIIAVKSFPRNQINNKLKFALEVINLNVRSVD